MVSKWYFLLEKMTWADVRSHFTPELIKDYKTIPDESKIDLTKFKPLRGDNVTLSKFCGLPPSKRSRLARASANAKARGEESLVGKFTLVNLKDKMQVRNRGPKYPEMSKTVANFILQGWHSGSPVTRHDCYQKAVETCKKNGAFFKQYVDPKKSSASAQLSHWVTRLLKQIGFSSRKETVSQKVPENWVELSKAFSIAMLEKFRTARVDVVLCADQTFIRYRLAKEKLLVPKGLRRVGTTTVEHDERKGVTLMLTAYVEKNWRTGDLASGVLPPFLVFNGKTGATLDNRYSDWCQRPGHSGSMNFQSKHWFDAVITLRWVNWLVDQFPRGTRLGLVWDACPSHLSQLVQARLKELEDTMRLFTVAIPGGMTSILQLGDIRVNGPCKKSLRLSYLSYKLNEVTRRKAAGERGKIVIKVTRDQLMTWTEDFVNNFNIKERSGVTNIIIPCLTKVGQNIFSHDNVTFSEWLDGLNENALYKALLNAHTAEDL